jgi:D-beta-D-heptose 7-phosphate kinase/D-beta-D-heptose 1-phosphate adenosyltransferase
VTNLNTVARRVFDVTGAGDTVIAAFTSAVASGASLPEAAFISNQAAGMVVEELGTAQVSRFELFSQIKRYLKGEASGKIVSLERLLALKDQWKDKKVVFTNGVFDLLHYGHIKLLTDCKKLGDILIVGLNSDRSVHRIKGPERPIIPYTDRSRVLAALEAVDYVIPFDDETPLELIKNIKPDILAKGADYAISEIVGAEQVKNNGGEVVRVKLQPGLSTTEIINRIVATSES